MDAAPPASALPIPHRLNLLLSAIIVAVLLFELFILPHVLLPHSPHWGWLLLLLLPANPLMWALIHEAIHGMLHPDRLWNHRLGRMLSICFGTSFHVVRFGHLMHHRFNRDWESERYDPHRTHWLKRAPGYYAYLFGGLYLIEAALSIALLLPERVLRLAIGQLGRHGHPAICPQGRHPAESYFFKRERLPEARQDIAAGLALHGLALAAYGEYWPLFLAFLAGRAVTISFLDNIYHYDTPADNSVPARELSLPRLASGLILHFNHHQTHHRHANAPWLHLPALHQAKGGQFDDSFLHAALRQLRGPVPNGPARRPSPGEPSGAAFA